MTGYLLDTNATLIALTNPSRLSTRARRALEAGPNVLSVIVYWEVVLKSMKGALEIQAPHSWWQDALNQLGATTLLFKPEHVGSVLDLPPIHRDPFDRALVAQATVESLALVSTDADIARYASGRFRLIA